MAQVASPPIIAPKVINKRKDTLTAIAAAIGMATCPRKAAKPRLKLICPRVHPLASHKGSIKAFMPYRAQPCKRKFPARAKPLIFHP